MPDPDDKVREHYEAHDTSAEMEEGEWVDPRAGDAG